VVAHNGRHSCAARSKLPCDAGTEHTRGPDHHDVLAVQFTRQGDNSC